MRANAFTKVGHAISLAARERGGDPSANFSLRLAIEKAKEVNFPKENIDRAIKRGTGELEGTVLEEIVYEGFGPGGIGILVDVVTDNKNRSAGEVKNIFGEHGGAFAGQGSVKWQFSRCGVVRTTDERMKAPDSELQVIEAGADDILDHDDSREVRSSVDNFQNVLEKIQSLGIHPEDAGIEWIAKETITVDPRESEILDTLVDALDSLDDVRAVYTNKAV